MAQPSRSASELKALKSLHSAQLDPAAVDAYLALGYVPAPLAIFRNCHKLPAGHWLRFRAGQIEIHRWWFPEALRHMERLPPRPPTSGDLAGTLRDLIADCRPPAPARRRSDCAWPSAAAWIPRSSRLNASAQETASGRLHGGL